MALRLAGVLTNSMGESGNHTLNVILVTRPLYSNITIADLLPCVSLPFKIALLHSVFIDKLSVNGVQLSGVENVIEPDW